MGFGGWGKGKFGGGWSPWQPMFMKWGKGKGKGKGYSGLKVDPSLKCWIGNLPEGTERLIKTLKDRPSFRVRFTQFRPCLAPSCPETAP